jgi:hypothetical protein
MTHRISMAGWLLVFVVAAVLAAGAATAPAQERSEADARAAAYRVVASSCAAEIARFCPQTVQTSTFPRDKVICLRPYRNDLSPGCRRAMTAATKPAEP